VRGRNKWNDRERGRVEETFSDLNEMKIIG